MRMVSFEVIKALWDFEKACEIEIKAHEIVKAFKLKKLLEAFLEAFQIQISKF